ncbi:MAG: Gamma-glutamyltranspeptidase [Opitutae bacterium]|nr:Gamma-glutamyltranspeptidase [Opitutae bacterium]
MQEAQEIVRHGVVAAGHRETARAAIRMLESGGNAFDAAAAGFFAACVAEPIFCSPAGGGFLLARTPKGDVVYDFFNQTPLRKRRECAFYPVLADFGDSVQEFHLGAGSWATPGAVPGVIRFQHDLGRLPLQAVVEPAVKLAREGVVVTPFCQHLMEVVSAIYLRSEAGRKLFGNPHRPHQPLRAGQRFLPEKMADFFLGVAGDPRLVTEGEIAREMARSCRERGGHLTREDFASYRVRLRKPLKLRYRSGAIWTNPAPSIGGILIGLALELLKDYPLADYRFGSPLHLEILVRVQNILNRKKRGLHDASTTSGEMEPENSVRSNLQAALRDTLQKHPLRARGTTHVSVLDTRGNAAAMSVSNGSGSGFVLGDYGFTMNNMLGEEDLNPNGFHLWSPNRRIASMMAPTFVEDGGSLYVTGSGGSNRIRTAVLQVISNLIDFDMGLATAVEAPRVHFEHGTVNVEPGFPAPSMAHLESRFERLLPWRQNGLFFGGTHSVQQEQNKAVLRYQGDARRAGAGIRS